MFNKVDMVPTIEEYSTLLHYDVRNLDVMGKACGDRHLSLFAFVIYGLTVFPKALGYMS
ncbi:hypothetical protein Golax_003672, partial [Gossypium laxum]|nr:hypothetical protein [Gossypium laxum]